MKKFIVMLLVMVAMVAMASTALAERSDLPGGGVGVTRIGAGR